MRIILSPAKKMNTNTDDLGFQGLPVFLEETEEILHFLQGLSYVERKMLWACNDQIALENSDRLKDMDLRRQLTPYRLEMQAKAKIAGKKNLYEYWGDRLYREVRDESGIIINLASKEYSKCIEKYLKKEDTFISCIFAELVGDKLVQKGVYAKMARGEMIRFMAMHHVENPEEMKEFCQLGYHFRADLSDERTFVFIKK